jgi:hypothetical protein
LNIATINGIPAEEFNERQAEWQAACRTMNLKPEMFNLEKLIKTLAGQTWMRQCEIIPDYMPPFPREDTASLRRPLPRPAPWTGAGRRARRLHLSSLTREVPCREPSGTCMAMTSIHPNSHW